jgi:predicted Zn-dependent protease
MSLFLGISGGLNANQDRLVVLRDVEIEATLRSYIQPIFQQAGLTLPVRFLVLLDPQINAAAGSGGLMLINSGFLLAAKSADEVVAVLAHETGHIAGGHVVRFVNAMEKQLMMALATAALGVTGGILLGSSEVAMASAMGAFQAGERMVLSYSRGQESAADQAALRYLDGLKWPLTGLMSFLQVLDREEFLAALPNNPYTRTHPPTEERVAAMRAGISQRIQMINRSLPQEFHDRFTRMQAKLFAFTNKPEVTLRLYKAGDLPSLYAQAVAYHRQGETVKSLGILDRIIKMLPRDAYVLDLRAQILLDSGQINAACTAYEQALGLLPEDSLLMIDAARAFLALPNPNLPKAISLLERAQAHERENPLLWHYLSIAYGKRGDMGMMALALAEEAAAKGDKEARQAQAERALRFLNKGTPGYIRAADIVRMTNDEKL